MSHFLNKCNSVIYFMVTSHNKLMFEFVKHQKLTSKWVFVAWNFHFSSPNLLILLLYMNICSILYFRTSIECRYIVKNKYSLPFFFIPSILNIVVLFISFNFLFHGAGILIECFCTYMHCASNFSLSKNQVPIWSFICLKIIDHVSKINMKLIIPFVICYEAHALQKQYNFCTSCLYYIHSS